MEILIWVLSGTRRAAAWAASLKMSNYDNCSENQIELGIWNDLLSSLGLSDLWLHVHNATSTATCAAHNPVETNPSQMALSASSLWVNWILDLFTF